MATLSMKSEIFVNSKYAIDSKTQSQQRPRRLTRPSHYIENGSFDPELSLAIKESLQLHRQNELKRNNIINENGKREKRNTANVTCQTDFEDTTESLKQIIKSNLELLSVQQNQIDSKDRDIKKLLAENEALLCRVERMDRRLSMLKQKDETSAATPISSFVTGKKQTIKRKIDLPDETPKKAHDCKSIVKVDEQISSSSRRGQKPRLSKDIDTAGATRQIPRRSRLTVSNIKKEKSTEILTTTEEYCNDTLLSQSPASLDVAIHEDVEVPSWSVQIFKNIYQMEGTENITDEAYLRRHQKPEIEEKRRKRWDLQRLREQQAYDRQRDQSMDDGSPGSPRRLCPPLSNITHIEVSDVLPVSVFGNALPHYKETPFQLSWKPSKTRHSRHK